MMGRASWPARPTTNDEPITAESEHYQIQWLRDGAAIPDANGLTYTATKADRGHTLTAAASPAVASP